MPVTLKVEPHQTIVWQNFIIVDYPSPYNAILGHPTLGKVKDIISTYHLMMKFSTSIGIGEVKGKQKVVKQCFISAMRAEFSSKLGDKALRDGIEEITLTDSRETKNTKPLEEVAPISIHPDYPDRHVMIGTELTNELWNALVEFLKKNYDVFSWSQGNVPGKDLKPPFTSCLPIQIIP